LIMIQYVIVVGIVVVVVVVDCGALRGVVAE